MEITGILILDQIFGVVIQILATALAILAMSLVKKIADHFGLKIEKEQEEKLERTIEKAILEAEEKFVQDDDFKAKAEQLAMRLYGVSDKGKAKLAYVVSKALDKLPGITKEEAEELTHSLLPKLSENGIGAIGAEIRKAMLDEDSD